MRFLTENIVTNPDVATSIAENLAKKVTLPQTRAWLAKRVRHFLLNSDHEALHTIDFMASDISDIEGTGIPQYAIDAYKRGEKVFAIDPDSYEYALANRFEHIVHFFLSLEETAQITPSNDVETNRKRAGDKLLSKLNRMTVEQVEKAHEKWASLFPNSGVKSGVEVVLRFADGYHWVRYTEKETMMADGEDLQNCLRQGMYWDYVERGEAHVFGLRTPGGEAVVGVMYELSNKKIHECKGKQNDPVHEKYREYVVGLFSKIKPADVGEAAKLDIYRKDDEYLRWRDAVSATHVGGYVLYFGAVARAASSLFPPLSRGEIWRENTLVGKFSASAREPQKVLSMQDVANDEAMVDALQTLSLEGDPLRFGPIMYMDGKWDLRENLYEHVRELSSGHGYSLYTHTDKSGDTALFITNAGSRPSFGMVKRGLIYNASYFVETGIGSPVSSIDLNRHGLELSEYFGAPLAGSRPMLGELLWHRDEQKYVYPRDYMPPDDDREITAIPTISTTPAEGAQEATAYACLDWRMSIVVVRDKDKHIMYHMGDEELPYRVSQVVGGITGGRYQFDTDSEGYIIHKWEDVLEKFRKGQDVKQDALRSFYAGGVPSRTQEMEMVEAAYQIPKGPENADGEDVIVLNIPTATGQLRRALGFPSAKRLRDTKDQELMKVIKDTVMKSRDRFIVVPEEKSVEGIFYEPIHIHNKKVSLGVRESVEDAFARLLLERKSRRRP